MVRLSREGTVAEGEGTGKERGLTSSLPLTPHKPFTIKVTDAGTWVSTCIYTVTALLGT